LEGVETGLEGLVDLLDTLVHEGLLDGEQHLHHIVVLADNQLKTHGPSAISVGLFEQSLGLFWHFLVLKEQVFDLTEGFLESCVKVHLDEASEDGLRLVVNEEIRIGFGLFTHKQEFVELILSVLLNVLDAHFDFGVNAVSLELSFE